MIRFLLFSVVIASLVLAGCAQPTAPPEAPPAATEAPAQPEEPEEPVVTEAPVATEAPVETEAPAAPTEPAPPAEKKVITLIWTQEFDTLNSLYSNMWFVSATYPIYACQAWWFDDQNQAVPNLVTEIPSVENGGVSEDGRTITLKLRDESYGRQHRHLGRLQVHLIWPWRMATQFARAPLTVETLGRIYPRCLHSRTYAPGWRACLPG
jgi:ABC-type transport system substrate-binding protein